MAPQFDVRQKSLLQSSFNRSLNKIKNEKEKEEFIKKGNEENKPEIQTEEIKSAIEKVNKRLSDESITSNSLRDNPKLNHLYDTTVVNRINFAQPKQKTEISLGELFNQNVDEKVSIKPKDPLDYVRSVLGQSSAFSSFSNLERYKPLTSIQDLLRERGKFPSFFNWKRSNNKNDNHNHYKNNPKSIWFSTNCSNSQTSSRSYWSNWDSEFWRGYHHNY